MTREEYEEKLRVAVAREGAVAVYTELFRLKQDVAALRQYVVALEATLRQTRRGQR